MGFYGIRTGEIFKLTMGTGAVLHPIGRVRCDRVTRAKTKGFLIALLRRNADPTWADRVFLCVGCHLFSSEKYELVE